MYSAAERAPFIAVSVTLMWLSNFSPLGFGLYFLFLRGLAAVAVSVFLGTLGGTSCRCVAFVTGAVVRVVVIIGVVVLTADGECDKCTVLAV